MTQLDLRQFAATHFPQELFGRSEFPPIGDGFYPLTVGAWGFYWCELQPLPEDDLRRAQFFSCFISYSVRDREFAERLHQDLLESGVRCWFAPRDAQSGQKLYGQIKKAIGFTRAGAVDLVRAQHEE